MEEVIIYTDGASKGNPGPGGWGALIVAEDSVRELGGREASTTNNRMELTAALEALRQVEKGEAPVVVYTDSSYLIRGMSSWVLGWQARGWVTAKKEPVLNRDLWEALVRAVKSCEHPVAWEYVGGHIGIPGNERVDRIASDFAEGKKVSLYIGPLQTYPVAVLNRTAIGQKEKTKSAARSRSKSPAYSYVSKVDGVILVHKTWAECEARVRGKNARFKKATSAQEEARIIAEFS